MVNDIEIFIVVYYKLRHIENAVLQACQEFGLSQAFGNRKRGKNEVYGELAFCRKMYQIIL